MFHNRIWSSSRAKIPLKIIFENTSNLEYATVSKLGAKHVLQVLWFQLCDTSPDNDENSQIYSAPVAELGSTTNLCEKSTENGRNGDKARLSGGGGTSKQVQKQQKGQQPLSSSSNSVSVVGQEGQQMVASGNTRQSTKPSDDNVSQKLFQLQRVSHHKVGLIFEPT